MNREVANKLTNLVNFKKEQILYRKLVSNQFIKRKRDSKNID